MRLVDKAPIEIDLKFVLDFTEFGVVSPVARQHLLKAYGAGPKLAFMFEAKREIFHEAAALTRKSWMPFVVPLQPTKKKNPSKIAAVYRSLAKRYEKQTRKGWWAELVDDSGSLTQVVALDEPVKVPLRRDLIVSAHDGRGRHVSSRDLMEVPEYDLINLYWKVVDGVDRCFYENRPFTILRVADSKRFPTGPRDELTFSLMSEVENDARFGQPWPIDSPLAFGYDRELERYGFSVNQDGFNCVTDFHTYSFPLRAPSESDWAQNPLPMPFDLIQPMRNTPRDSWADTVRLFVGRRLGGITMGSGPMSVECVEPTAVDKGRDKKKRDERPEQPCYHGPSVMFWGKWRYLIFQIERPGGTVYLVDSKWRDRECAMSLFMTGEDAEAFCVSGETAGRIGRKVHNPARGSGVGWDGEGMVERWIDRCVDRWRMKQQGLSGSDAPASAEFEVEEALA